MKTRVNASTYTIHSYAKYWKLFIIAAIFITSCAKDGIYDNSPIQLNDIEKAKVALQSESSKRTIIRNSTESYKTVNKTVNWEKAFSKTVGDTVYVYAPVIMANEVRLKGGETDGLSFNQISWMVSYRVNDKFKFYSVLRVPEKASTQPTLIVDDWFYEKNSSYIKKTFGANTQDTPRGGVTTMSIICYSFQYTICVGDGSSMSCGTRSQEVCTNLNNPVEHFDPDYEGGGTVTPVGPTLPGAGGVGSGNGQGGSTSIKISTLDRLQYPSLAKIVDGLLEKVKNDARLMGALKAFSHLTEEQIIANLQSGEGPEVIVVDNMNVSGDLGEYNPVTNQLQIAKKVATETNYYSATSPTATEFFLSSIILHEFVHFGENTTQIFLSHDGWWDDAGMQFENSYYGGRLDYNYVTRKITLKPL